MRAIAIDEFGGPERLKLRDLSRPKPARGEVLIRVVAAGVNPVDWKIREGRLKDVLPHAFPLILGWDVAGVVEELGEQSGRFRKGERVFCYARKPTVQWGAYAEYIAVPEKHAALMPTNLLFEEAASVPLAALTAYQALFGKAAVGQGKAVLVHAAAGGVGHFAVQLARNAGARVFGTAGSANQQFVLSMGAEAALDYTREDFRESLRRLSPDGVDVVLDAVGGDVQSRSLDVLKRDGWIVSITDPLDMRQLEARGIHGEYVFVEPNADQLKTLAGQMERGKLGTSVAKIYPLAEAAQAHLRSKEGHVRGKLVLAL